MKRSSLLLTLLLCPLASAQTSAAQTSATQTSATQTTPTPDRILSQLQNGDWTAALKNSQQAVQAHPNSARAWLLKARSEARLEQYASAQKSLQHARSLPEWQQLNLQVPVRSRAELDDLAQRDPQQALGLIADGLLAYPGNAQLLFLSALAHDRLGERDAARRALQGAEVAAPGLPFAEPRRLQALRADLGMTQGHELEGLNFNAPEENGPNPIDQLMFKLIALFALLGTTLGLGYWGYSRRAARKQREQDTADYNTFAMREEKRLQAQMELSQVMTVSSNPQEREAALQQVQGQQSLIDTLWKLSRQVKDGTLTNREAQGVFHSQVLSQFPPTPILPEPRPHTPSAQTPLAQTPQKQPPQIRTQPPSNRPSPAPRTSGSSMSPAVQQIVVIQNVPVDVDTTPSRPADDIDTRSSSSFTSGSRFSDSGSSSFSDSSSSFSSSSSDFSGGGGGDNF